MTSATPDEPVQSRLRLTGGRDRAVLIGALGILSAVSPLATDMYLASMPGLSTWFGTSASAVQLTLTTYMVGMALGQFFIGPVSDVLGRHRLLVAGNALFLLCSVLIVFAPSIGVMMALRALQGAAGAAGVVIARAIVADIATGRQAAKLYSILATITSVSPVVAPLLGGVIATVAPWQAVFWALTVFGLLMLVCSVVVVPETLPPAARHHALRSVLGLSMRVMRNGSFMAYALTFAFSFGSLFSYISASSFVIQNVLGFSALAYSVAFAVNACGAIAGGLINARLVDRVEPAAILRVAVTVMAAVNLVGLVLILSGITGWMTLVQLLIGQTAIGFIMGNAVAQAQSRVPGLAGAGAAVLGLLQFVLGGLVSPLTGIAGQHTAVPMALSMAVWSVLALGTAFLARRLSR
ncbi:multidrug effflux MFS transporter [Tersicoccus sp. Bi-70]|uniref:multidrug effflux MFS transporter n=1 Tax=Tersicoccus sp. Bi-70 TaxID=1897634 RepID=UPI0018E9782B|nr:multidrug effflux MFS transporter [Tersicoccus sp. Bi-70]